MRRTSKIKVWQRRVVQTLVLKVLLRNLKLPPLFTKATNDAPNPPHPYNCLNLTIRVGGIERSPASSIKWEKQFRNVHIVIKDNEFIKSLCQYSFNLVLLGRMFSTVTLVGLQGIKTSYFSLAQFA